MRSELGEAFVNWRPVCALQITQASVNASVRGSHEVRVGGSLRELETSLCSADNAGQREHKCVCVNSGV